jgi:hypothetical protein
MRRPSQRGSRYATFRSCLPRAAPLAGNSYTRFAWITLRIFYTVAHCWVHASLLARSLPPAAFAIIRISREDSAIGLVIRRVRTRGVVKAPVME